MFVLKKSSIKVKHCMLCKRKTEQKVENRPNKWVKPVECDFAGNLNKRKVY